MRLTALLCVVAVLGVSVAPAAAATGQSNGYAGTNVTFETKSDAIVDYAVGGSTMSESLQVQSTSSAEGGGLIGTGADLAAVTKLDGSALSVSSKTELRASVETESGATITAHDDGRGVLVVDAGGESQYVTANLSSGASAENQDDGRVVVTTADGTKGTYLVVGEGQVTVNDEGNVAAKLGSDGKLVFRAYPEGRSDDDRQQEQLIADGTAAAEVYVTQSAEASNEFAADVVSYSRDTTVEVTESSEGTVRMTADRSQSDGRVILTTVSERAIGSADNLQVTVDGEAAAEASSYSELQSAANGGETSKFLVRQQSSASASTDVLVGVNHFSERQVEMSGDGTDSGSGGGGASAPGQPGFGLLVTLLALLVVAAIARYRG